MDSRKIRREGGARGRLVEAARTLFGEKGYDGTSVRSIARKARCNLALIHHYFGSKEGLLREIVAEGRAPVEREIVSLAELQAPTEERFRRFIGFLVDYFDQHRPLLQIFYREVIQTKRSVVADLRPAARAHASLVSALLEEARSQGILAEIDPRVVGLLLMGMIQTYFINYPLASMILGRRSDELLSALKRNIAQVFLHGVLTERREVRS